MTDLVRQLWETFRAEAAENLQQAELALIQAEAAPIDRETINGLFRSMHSVKGACRMMNMTSMEHVAHAAEDLLSMVRDEAVPLDQTLVDCLLQSTDTLKTMLHHAVEQQADPGTASHVLQRLREVLESLRNRAPLDPPTEPDTAKQGLPTPIIAAPPAALQAFGDACAAIVLPLLAHILPSEPQPANETDGEAVQQHAVIACEHLAVAAQTLGFRRLRAAAEALRETIGAPEADSLLQLGHLSEVVDALRYVERETGVDCGIEGQHAELASRIIAPIQKALEVCASHARPALPDEERSPPYSTLADAWDHLSQLMILAGHDPAWQVAKLAAQICRAHHSGKISCRSELPELLLQASRSLHDTLGHAAHSSEFIAECDHLMQDLRRAMLTPDAKGRLDRAQQEISQHITIAAELQETLSVEATAELLEALRRGAEVYEIEAELDSDLTLATRFITWLEENGRVHTSRSRMCVQIGVDGAPARERPWTLFLLSLHISEVEVRQTLARLDPHRRHLFLRRRGDSQHDSSEFVAPNDRATEKTSSGGRTPEARGEESPSRSSLTDSGAELVAAGTIRVQSDILDRFVRQVGELMTLRTTLTHALEQQTSHGRLRQCRDMLLHNCSHCGIAKEFVAQTISILDDIESERDTIKKTDARLQSTLSRLQEDVMDLRVVPVALVFTRLPRMIRALAREQDKQVRVQITGEQVQIDKSMVEVLAEPLIHLVRNCVDHGVESPSERVAAGKPAQATVTLAAHQRGNTVIVEVSDDGRGIALQKVRARAESLGLLSEDATPGAKSDISERDLLSLIFAPGMSTAGCVSEVSGRGVGLDLVKSRLAQLGGQVEVTSTRGLGTVFTLRLPLSVAIQPVILVRVGSQRLALPERHVTEVIEIDPDDLQSLKGQAAFVLRGVLLPVFRLSQLLGYREPEDEMFRLPERIAPERTEKRQKLGAVIISNGAQRVGAVVDRIEGRHELFVRDVHPDIVALPGLGGASVLGDGSVVMIVDCEELLYLAERTIQSQKAVIRAS